MGYFYLYVTRKWYVDLYLGRGLRVKEKRLTSTVLEICERKDILIAVSFFSKYA